MQRLTDHFVDGIVVNCAFLHDHLVRDFGVPAERIHVCYNGIDLERFASAGPSMRGTRVPRDAVTIGVVAVQRPEKGLATLLTAFAQLESYRELRLILVGSGPVQSDLKARARALGIQDRCIWQDATNDVAPWLRAIDIFVLPSESEALSNAMTEAMAVGCCPVASAVGGNPELLAPDRGILFPVGAAEELSRALQSLIVDEPRRKQLALNARAFATHRFSATTAARNMAAIYRQILNAEAL
jgi:glycosyltransferase involved in cell wall biosynthesis